MPQHEVQQGECISSIAQQYGFHWETIWNHPDNAALAAKRMDPNILMPGDIVSIPEKEIREENRPAEQLHVFQRLGAPSILRLRLRKWGKARANLEYLLDLEGCALSHGKTSPEGTIEATIPSGATTGKLILIADGVSEEYPLKIGSMNPVDQLSGAAWRLHNLGYDLDPIETGALEARLSGAVRAFQKEQDLTVTGEADEATCARLKEIYGA